MEKQMPQRDLTDLQYERLLPLLPPVKPPRGRTNLDHRPILNGMLWILRTGSPWRDLPERYGKYKTVHSRFRRWTHSGLWNLILLALQNRAQGREDIDWTLHHVDSTSIKAQVSAAGARRDGRDAKESARQECLGRSRGGWTTKVHLRIEGGGKVMSLYPSQGQRHDSQFFEEVMKQTPLQGKRGRPRQKPKRVVGDLSLIHI